MEALGGKLWGDAEEVQMFIYLFLLFWMPSVREGN